MKNSTLRSILNKVNINPKSEGIFIRPLSQSVSFAKVWLNRIKPTDNIAYPGGPYKFYFVNNEQTKYVGIVLDMHSDLHWYVLPEFRKNGFLTKALNETILPHLFQDGREHQRITIDRDFLGPKNFTSSEKVALSCGFKERSDAEGEYILTRDKYNDRDHIDGENTPLTKGRVDTLTKRINYISRSLWLIQNEVEMKIGDLEYAEDIKDLVDEIRSHTLKLEDKWYENSNA